MKGKFLEGCLYKIRFLDHCIGKHSSMTCEVVGWVLKQDDTEVVLTYWRVDTEDADIKRDNVEPVVILKSTIIRKRKIN